MKEMHMKVRLTFTTPILGSAPANEDIYRTYIASKAPDGRKMEQEIEDFGVEGVAEKGKTVFLRMADGTPYFQAYQIKGFFKGTCKALKKVPGTLSGKVKAYKQEINDLIFVVSDGDDEDKIPFLDWGVMEERQRPLRASTPMGERVSIAVSDQIAEGAMMEFTVVCLVPEDVELVREWLNHGKKTGLGQWRNGGNGKFTWEELSCEEVEVA